MANVTHSCPVISLISLAAATEYGRYIIDDILNSIKPVYPKQGLVVFLLHSHCVYARMSATHLA